MNVPKHAAQEVAQKLDQNWLKRRTAVPVQEYLVCKKIATMRDAQVRTFFIRAERNSSRHIFSL